MKKCPYCAEMIQDEAVVCRYCNRDVPVTAAPPVQRKKRGFLRFLLIFLAGCLVLSLFAAGWVWMQYHRRQSLLAITSQVLFNYGGDIWTYNPDGTNFINLTKTNDIAECGAVYSPDRTQIVFTDCYGGILYIMKSDGTNRRVLVSDEFTYRDPKFSPDGEQLLFVENDFRYTSSSKMNNIILLDLLTHDRKILYTAETPIEQPAFSPDGKQIAFFDAGSFLIISPEGHILLKKEDPGKVYKFGPTWSPDGKMIAYSAVVDKYKEGRITTFINAVFLMNADGSQEKRISQTENSDYPEFFTSDGRQIVFLSDDPRIDKGPQLYAVNLDGSNQHLVSDVSFVDKISKPTLTARALLPTPKPTPTPITLAMNHPFEATLTLQANIPTGNLPSKEEVISRDCIRMGYESDFVAEAAFHNPYSIEDGRWNYGFTFRDADAKQYRISVTSNHAWSLSLWNQKEKENTYLSSGDSGRIHSEENQKNRLKLIARKKTGYFYINDELVTTLDLSDLQLPGDLCIAYGITKNGALPGKNLTYEDFKVWSMKTDYEPADPLPTLEITSPFTASLNRISRPVTGNLFRMDDLISATCYEEDLPDFVTDAVFTNPYSTGEGKWDFGFLFRNTGFNQQYRLVVHSEQEWEFINFLGDTHHHVASGSFPIHTGPDQTNHLKLIASGTNGYFYINDQFVATLDLSERMTPGSVCVGRGMTTGDKLPEEFTPFTDFNLWAIKTAE